MVDKICADGFHGQAGVSKYLGRSQRGKEVHPLTEGVLRKRGGGGVQQTAQRAGYL